MTATDPTLDALWRAAEAHPEDAVVRLVLADAVEESGFADLAAGLRGTAWYRPINFTECWSWANENNVSAGHPDTGYVPYDVFRKLARKYDPTGRSADACKGYWKDYPTWRAAVEDLARAWAEVNLGAEVRG